MSEKDQSDKKIEKYVFPSFTSPKLSAKDAISFSFQELTPDKQAKTLSSEVIRKERVNASKASFSIASEVKVFRGLKKQEDEDFNNLVQSEVTLRLESVRQKAYDLAYEEGLKLGEAKALEEFNEKLSQSVELLKTHIDSLIASREEIIKSQGKDILKAIQVLVKWIILKEIDNKDYLSRLLEKLVQEMNVKDNIVVKVNESFFDSIPSLVDELKKKLSTLKNVRIERDITQSLPGIILETQNGLIDGSFETQMNALNKLFETFGIEDDQQLSKE